MKPKYRDPNCEENSAKYHTGKKCIEKYCRNPAGTAWGELWCWQHNAERLDRIDKTLKKMEESFGGFLP